MYKLYYWLSDKCWVKLVLIVQHIRVLHKSLDQRIEIVLAFLGKRLCLYFFVVQICIWSFQVKKLQIPSIPLGPSYDEYGGFEIIELKWVI